MTDEEADAWVEEEPSTRGVSEGTGVTKGAETLGDGTEKEEAARAKQKQKCSAEEKETRTTRDAPTASREKKNDSGVVVPPALSAEEEHPPPPSTPPARGFSAVSLRARSRRRAYWDAEFPGLLAFESPLPDGADDDDFFDAPDEASSEASRRECVSDDVHRATNATNATNDFFFFESAVDDAVHKFNVWFDASLRVLGDSIAEKFETEYAPKVERLFERGVSALDAEWRAQFPDDATYVSEMSKKEYPSEANAVMRAATRGDEKEKRALPKKGARAD